MLRAAALAIVLFSGQASSVGVQRNLLSAHRVHEDESAFAEASRMNEYTSTVMTTLRSASRDLTEALNTTHPTAKVITGQAKINPAAVVTSGKTEVELAIAKESPAHKFSNKTVLNLQKQQDVLQKLFTHLKSNIGKFNERESTGKVEEEASIKEMEAKYAKDEALLKKSNGTRYTFEHELLVNTTRSDKLELDYRKQERQLGHSMFHANLKATHGLMSRIGSVMEAYKQALATGHVDANIKEAMVKSLISPPKAFVETRRELRRTKTRKH